MRIELPDDRVRLDGAAAVETAPGRVAPHRIAPEYAHELPVEAAFVEGMPSGVRLVVDTDATSIGIECTPMRLTIGGKVRPSTFELVVDGAVIDSAEAEFGNMVSVELDESPPEFTAGEPGQVVLVRPANLGSTVEIWLPQSAGVALHALVIPDGATISAAPTDDRPRWIHHGSSISHCMEASGPTSTWPAVAAAATGYHVTNLGIAGQCHVDQFAARTIRDLPADRISLKFGINVVNGDTMRVRTFTSAVHGFLDTVREGHPDTPILLISPIICPAVETVPGPTLPGDDGRFFSPSTEDDLALGRLSLQRIRAILEGIVEKRRLVGDANLTYLDGRELFGDDDVEDLEDGLHPNAAGYLRIGQRFADGDFLTV